MRVLLLAAVATATLSAQTMTEAAAAMAGSTVGGVAGKQVSSGIDKIFGKTGDVLKGAAKQGQAGTKEPLLKVGPGKPKEDAATSVPPPPPVAGERPVRRATPAVAAPAAPRRLEPEYVAPAPPPPPPPPTMTREALALVAAGTSREDLLRGGAPSSRVMMFDGGHLVEVYRYQSRDNVLGTVRLTDGAVAKVEVR